MPAILTIQLEGITLTKSIPLNKIPKQGNLFHTDAFDDLPKTFDVASCKWEYPIKLIYHRVQLNRNDCELQYKCELQPILSKTMKARFSDFHSEPRFTLLLIDCLTNETEGVLDNGWKFDKEAYASFVKKHHLEDFTETDIADCMFGMGFIAV